MHTSDSYRDVLASSGVAEGTPIDTFFNMQGNSCFLEAEDIFGETFSHDEVLYAGSEMVSIGEDAEGRFQQEI